MLLNTLWNFFTIQNLKGRRYSTDRAMFFTARDLVVLNVIEILESFAWTLTGDEHRNFKGKSNQ